MSMETRSPLQDHREAKGWTRAYCASQVGVSENTWARWEWGHMNPRVANLFKVARLFGVGVAELLVLTDEKKADAASTASAA